MSLDQVGAILYKERCKKSLSLKDIAQATCIRSVYLEKIENGQQDLLPARTYVRGFIKAYAKALSLDAKPLLDIYTPIEGHLEVSKVRDFNKELKPFFTLTNISLMVTIAIFSGLIFWMNLALESYPVQLSDETTQPTLPVDVLKLPQKFPLNTTVSDTSQELNGDLEHSRRKISSVYLLPKKHSVQQSQDKNLNKKEDDSPTDKVKNDI